MTQEATTQALERRQPTNQVIGMNMRDLNDAAALIFDSKVFGDLQSKEAAAIKIIAGAEKGFTPFQSMAMFDFIQGRPTLNAHGKATLINSSGDFRLKIIELTPSKCVIDVLRNTNGEWKKVNTSSFTIEDAALAELTTGANKHSWKKYPRNMLFARCVSNIWRWDCAELNTRKISPDQINEFTADELAEDDVNVIEGEIVMDDGETVDTATGEVIDAEGQELMAAEAEGHRLQSSIQTLCSDLNATGLDSIKWAKGTLNEYVEEMFGDGINFDAANVKQLATVERDLTERLAALQKVTK